VIDPKTGTPPVSDSAEAHRFDAPIVSDERSRRETQAELLTEGHQVPVRADRVGVLRASLPSGDYRVNNPNYGGDEGCGELVRLFSAGIDCFCAERLTV
jgi:hypothetical protein